MSIQDLISFVKDYFREKQAVRDVVVFATTKAQAPQL